MRISDWSSDVCSSDLFWGSTSAANASRPSKSSPRKLYRKAPGRFIVCEQPLPSSCPSARYEPRRQSWRQRTAGVQTERKRVVQGKRGAVRVDSGGGRCMKKKQKTECRVDNITQ